jgi:hypothetical protein
MSECHSEAQPKNLLLHKPLEKQMLRFAQHDIPTNYSVATLLREREERGKGHEDKTNDSFARVGRYRIFC